MAAPDRHPPTIGATKAVGGDLHQRFALHILQIQTCEGHEVAVPFDDPPLEVQREDGHSRFLHEVVEVLGGRAAAVELEARCLVTFVVLWAEFDHTLARIAQICAELGHAWPKSTKLGRCPNLARCCL